MTTLTEDRLIRLLAEHGMELEILKGVSGVSIGYRVSKTFYNKRQAKIWMYMAARAMDAMAGGKDEAEHKQGM